MLIASLQAKVYQEPTFRVKKLLLHHVGIVHGIEIEGVFLALVFGVGDPHNVIPVSQRGQLSVAIFGLSQFGLGGDGRCTGTNNDIEFPLGLEKRSDTRNDSDAHDGCSNIHVSWNRVSRRKRRRRNARTRCEQMRKDKRNPNKSSNKKKNYLPMG
jgi:hypothetical protein